MAREKISLLKNLTYVFFINYYAEISHGCTKLIGIVFDFSKDIISRNLPTIWPQRAK